MFFFLQSPGAGDSGYVDSPPPDEMDSDGEDKINLDQNVGAQIGQDKGSVGTALLESALSGLPPRWRNWAIRGIFTWVMIGGFGFLIWGGPPILMLTVKKKSILLFFPTFRDFYRKFTATAVRFYFLPDFSCASQMFQ